MNDGTFRPVNGRPLMTERMELVVNIATALVLLQEIRHAVSKVTPAPYGPTGLVPKIMLSVPRRYDDHVTLEDLP